MKAEDHTDRDYLKGRDGGCADALFAGSGYNIGPLFKWREALSVRLGSGFPQSGLYLSNRPELSRYRRFTCKYIILSVLISNNRVFFKNVNDGLT